MSDDPTVPKVPSRPAAPRGQGQGTSRRRRPPPASPESKFVGYLVLGFGILAMIAVFVVALNVRKNRQEGQPRQTASQAPAQQTPAPAAQEQPKTLQRRVATDLASNFIPDPAATAPKPIVKKDLYFKRQPSIKQADILGAWQTQIGKYTAVLDIKPTSYQLILADPAQYGTRFYSTGTYSNIEDIFTFVPHNDWALPPSPPGVTIKYQHVTTASFPVIAAIEKGQMLWQNPPFSEKRVLVPYALSIIIEGDQRYLVWQRLK